MAARKKTAQSESPKKTVISKEQEQKIEAVRETVKETAGKTVKAVAAAVDTAKETAEKTLKKQKSVYIQFAGKEFSDKELLERVKDIWTKDMGRKVREMADVRVYVKPEESCAYYVINQDVTGKFPL